MRQGHLGAAWRKHRLRSLKRLAVAGCLAALSLAAGASPAAGSVTIGQLAPDGTPPVCATPAFDRLQPTVTSGNTYVVPGTGTITSWSHNASGPGMQMLTMKIFRKVAEPSTYLVVGHSGPLPLAGNTVSTFPTSIPVKPGDVLGLNQASPADTACEFGVSGESHLFKGGNIADGDSQPFLLTAPNERLNISAVFVPSNTFTLGATTRNKKKGTATITVNLPNPGELTASGKGVKAAGAAVTSKSVTAGPAQLLIKAKGKKSKLNETGKVKLNVAVTYTPTGGDPKTQSVKVKLIKR